MKSNISFLQKLRRIELNDFYAYWNIIFLPIIVVPLALAFIYWSIYFSLWLLTPKEHIPDGEVSFDNLDLIYSEPYRKNKDDRIFYVETLRHLDEDESNSYINQYKTLNNNRFDFGDIKDYMKLNRNVAKVNSELQTFKIDCVNGVFSLEKSVFKFDDDKLDFNPISKLKDSYKNLEVKEYSGIERITQEVCTPSKPKDKY